MPALLNQYGKPIAKSPEPPPARLRAGWDAAATTDENRRHWSNTDGYSADAAANPGVRKIIRERARYEFSNNSYARGIALSVANDMIGTGPRLQVRTGNRDADRKIEKLFLKWSQEVKLAKKLRTMQISKMIDGESFATLSTNRNVNFPVKLDLKVQEADRVTNPDWHGINPRDADGINLDEHGDPESYRILKDHPGDMSVDGTGMEHKTVPVAQVIHLFSIIRAEQHRGVSEIAPALPLFAMLRRYTLAVLAAAETAADFAGVMYTDSPALDQVDDIESMEAIELEMRAMLTLPKGWRLGQMKAEQPTTTYGEFKREILTEIFRCIIVPRNVALGDSSEYNFASGRLDKQSYYKSIQVSWNDIEIDALNRILMAWLDEAMFVDGFIPDDLPPFYEWDISWTWDGHEHIDPVKEANAQSTRLASFTTTLAAECAKDNKNWEDVLIQRAKEIEKMIELGIPILDGSQQNTEAPKEPEDEEPEDDEAEEIDEDEAEAGLDRENDQSPGWFGKFKDRGRGNPVPAYLDDYCWV